MHEEIGIMNAKRGKTAKGTSGKMPRTSVSLPADIHEQLDRLAKRKKVSVAWVIRDAVEKYLAADAPLFHGTR
jgi:metal-responsive CopG/Arc/MetJ family transcriptional regulator